MAEGEEGSTLEDDILETRISGIAVKTYLKTDDQVIARVTDGIYGQPAAAFRELISNAYDADATEVVIQTDRPRFRRITIADNGHGMNPAAVAHLIEHIGGSAKRQRSGFNLGVTSETDPLLSPGGRRLIGRIGIGLFSVSQLTQSFQIITKIKDEPWRTVAAVTLRQYGTEDRPEEGMSREAGLVTIWQEPAADEETHGTTIVLNGLKPAAQDVLRSSATWLRVERGIDEPPKYHVGAVEPSAEAELRKGRASKESVPWSKNDPPDKAFAKLVDAVTNKDTTGKRNPVLGDLLDYYLRMIWELSLAAPLTYVDEHPFDSRLAEMRTFALEGSGPSGITPIFPKGSLAADRKWPLGIGVSTDFRVQVDDLELRRPMKFRDLPTTSNKVKIPMLFVGHLIEEFEGKELVISGVPLVFYAYILWMPTFVPNDSIGSLVRIHGASGTGYDETFFGFQVAETTRLRQICCEIFVVQGLEAALNIDREKYNFSHPHVVRLTSWLHTALSRSIGAQKNVAKQILKEQRDTAVDEEAEDLHELVEQFWTSTLGDDADSPIPPVVWVARAGTRAADAPADAIQLARSAVVGSASTTSKNNRIAGKIGAIAQLLSAHGLLDGLDDEEVGDLLAAIGQVLRAEVKP